MNLSIFYYPEFCYFFLQFNFVYVLESLFKFSKMSETLRILDMLFLIVDYILHSKILREIKLSFTFKASNFFQKWDFQIRKKIL